MDTGRGSNFDTEHWYRERIHTRTKEALAEQDKAFITEFADAPDETLIYALHHRAKELGYTPYPVEVTGSALIIRRFGSWERAVKLAKLPHPFGAQRISNSERYRQEYPRQQKLHRIEQAAKREKRLRAHREREKARQQRQAAKHSTQVPTAK